MRATLNNTVMILSLAGLTLAGSAALAKGGNNGSQGSSNRSSMSFSKSMSSKSLGMKLSNSGNSSSSQSFKKNQGNNLIKSQLGTSLGSNGAKAKILQGNNVVKKMPKILDQGIGNGKSGNKVLDPGFNKNNGNKSNFCKDFGKNKCFDKHCFPWWGFGCSPCYDPCYSHCYDPCYYNGCYGGGVIVVEKPVLVTQPVVVQTAAVQPVVAQAAAIEPAAVADAEANLPKVPVGATLTLRGEAFGEQAGKVAMQVGELLLPATVSKWEAKAVTITLPQVGLAAAAKGKFLILKADGTLANEIAFELVPPQAPAVSQQ